MHDRVLPWPFERLRHALAVSEHLACARASQPLAKPDRESGHAKPITGTA